MKSFKSTLTLFVCGALFMVSCVTQDEIFNPLTGTWILKGVSCQNCIDKSQITSTTYSCNDTGCNTYTFRNNGTLTVVESIDGNITSTSGTYSISNSTVTLHFNDEAMSVKRYSYTFSGSVLYLKEIVDKSTGKCGATTVLAK